MKSRVSNRPEYTTLAQRYSARFPVLTYAGTQVNFWIIANVLLATVGWLVLRIAQSLFQLPVPVRLGPLVLLAVASGILYGLMLGLSGYYFEKSFFKQLSLGKVILFKSITSLMVLIILLLLTRFVLFDMFIGRVLAPQGILWTARAWDNLFWLLVVYNGCMTLVISFINQVNRKFGPGVLIPLLLGRYRNPKETERIFMFMDLKSSTTIAESLGHLRYSAFIRDCFYDINSVLLEHHAQVYQYAGDEIIVMWPVEDGFQNHSCLRFFGACKEQFKQRADYYSSRYGQQPQFKAGIHMGRVTAVEIGDIKRDIAYHGDTLNTAARIQSVCNEFDKELLASEYLMEQIGQHRLLKVESLGNMVLKGKRQAVGIVSVEWLPVNM